MHNDILHVRWDFWWPAELLEHRSKLIHISNTAVILMYWGGRSIVNMVLDVTYEILNYQYVLGHTHANTMHFRILFS